MQAAEIACESKWWPTGEGMPTLAVDRSGTVCIRVGARIVDDGRPSYKLGPDGPEPPCVNVVGALSLDVAVS